jgi:hypothetical protein
LFFDGFISPNELINHGFSETLFGLVFFYFLLIFFYFFYSIPYFLFFFTFVLIINDTKIRYRYKKILLSITATLLIFLVFYFWNVSVYKKPGGFLLPCINSLVIIVSIFFFKLQQNFDTKN